MSSPDGNGFIFDNIQLVVLDTLVHKSQNLVMTDPIKVSIEGIIRSCALITESECLVFTSREVFLVSLIDRTQKDIMLPQGLMSIYKSLNVMVNNTPYFIVATKKFNSQLISELEEQHPAQCHRIGQDDSQILLLTVIQYKAVE
jgi:hypothetical protein